jgi:hypothetical protein
MMIHGRASRISKQEERHLITLAAVLAAALFMFIRTRGGRPAIVVLAFRWAALFLALARVLEHIYPYEAGAWIRSTLAYGLAEYRSAVNAFDDEIRTTAGSS